MNIAIIGSGNMANGIGSRVIAGGHSLTIFDRDETKAKELANNLGKAQGKKLGDAILEDVIILALPYSAISQVLEENKNQLKNKIIVDISNPINFETFELVTPSGSSGTEEIAKNLPADAKLLKAFNTTFAGTLIEGKVDRKILDVFIAGDDEEAKNSLIQIIKDGGLRPIDVGSLREAHALEEVGRLHIKLQEKLGNTWMSTFKVLPD